MALAYKRILLKLSGEALAGGKESGLDFDTIEKICKSIKKCVDEGLQIGIVVGGGNFWRGRSSGNMDRTRADHMGMLATAINALAVADTLEQIGVTSRVQTGISMPQIAEPYIRNRAVRHLEKGRVTVFGCGTGNPFFSTDTGAALRAAEINADIIFKATNVDGVYDKDPNKYPDAQKYDRLTYHEVLDKELKVMDSTAASLCMDNGIDILVFNLNDPENIYRAACGEKVGTVAALDREFGSVRAGRANPSILDKVSVDYYGVATPVQQVATISVPDGRTIMIQPWDTSLLNAVEKAINIADIGINPNNDGKVIRLSFPPLTEERRKELVKEIHSMSEGGKVNVRNIRRDAIDKIKAMKKNNEITEDDMQNGEKKVQNLTDRFCKEIDSLTAAKEKEIMEI